MATDVICGLTSAAWACNAELPGLFSSEIHREGEQGGRFGSPLLGAVVLAGGGLGSVLPHVFPLDGHKFYLWLDERCLGMQR